MSVFGGGDPPDPPNQRGEHPDTDRDRSPEAPNPDVGPMVDDAPTSFHEDSGPVRDWERSTGSIDLRPESPSPNPLHSGLTLWSSGDATSPQKERVEVRLSTRVEYYPESSAKKEFDVIDVVEAVKDCVENPNRLKCAWEGVKLTLGVDDLNPLDGQPPTDASQRVQYFERLQRYYEARLVQRLVEIALQEVRLENTIESVSNVRIDPRSLCTPTSVGPSIRAPGTESRSPIKEGHLRAPESIIAGDLVSRELIELARENAVRAEQARRDLSESRQPQLRTPEGGKPWP